MDDRELEARLRARLHSRFDAAEPSYGLTSRIAADRVANPLPVRGGFVAWLGSARAGLAPAAALLLVVAVAGALVIGPKLGIGPWTGAPTFAPTTSTGPVAPSPSAPTSIDYRVTPITLGTDKAFGGAAQDMLAARLHSLGYGTFSGGQGDEIAFTLPGPYDPRVLQVLAWDGGATGYVGPDAQSVGLEVGSQLPPGLTEVFTNADVASVDLQTDPAPAKLTIQLTAAAAARLATATGAHLGGNLLIADGDGRIREMAVIQEPITGNSFTVSSGGDSMAAPLDVLAAVIGNPPQFDTWKVASVAAGVAGQPLDVLQVQAVSTVDTTFELEGAYWRSGEASNLQSTTTQCDVTAQASIVEGLGVDIEGFSLAPGTAIRSPRRTGTDFAPGAYRLVITADCPEWTVRLER